MELAIKARCAETIQFSLLHELSPFISFLCDQNPDKTCSTLSRSGAESKRVTNGFDLAVATPVFPHWVNNESGSQENITWPSSFMSSHTESIMKWELTKRFAGRPHACLPTVRQQCARLVHLTPSMRPNTNSLSLLSPASQSSMIPC